jgi:ribosome biogenesis GTPase
MKDDNHSHSRKRWVGCNLEADYFGEDRKFGKADRKKASAKDRSKYKKTDQRQQAKQKREAPPVSDQLERGRVLSIASQGIIVDVQGKMFTCTLRGALKKDKTLSKNLVAVGDFVLFEKSSPDEGYIAYVEPRRSTLSRAENLSRRKEQLIAANIDQVMITLSVVSPPLKPSLIDRYVIATLKGGMEPILVVNKIDLLESPDVDAGVRDVEGEIYKEMIVAYQKAGIPLIAVSTVTGEGIDRLKAAMKDKASVFSGQSGVGKSSLINAVTGQELRIGGIVGRTQKGTHTTSTAHLLPLDFGGWCIDTPGIKSFGVWDLEKEEVEQYFPEIFACGHQCRFPDCSHLREDGCAVITAVENGEISSLRYESYIALMESVSQHHFRR